MASTRTFLRLAKWIAWYAPPEKPTMDNLVADTEASAASSASA
jgi:hypothetical protein